MSSTTPSITDNPAQYTTKDLSPSFVGNSKGDINKIHTPSLLQICLLMMGLLVVSTLFVARVSSLYEKYDGQSISSSPSFQSPLYYNQWMMFLSVIIMLLVVRKYVVLDVDEASVIQSSSSSNQCKEIK